MIENYLLINTLSVVTSTENIFLKICIQTKVDSHIISYLIIHIDINFTTKVLIIIIWLKAI